MQRQNWSADILLAQTPDREPADLHYAPSSTMLCDPTDAAALHMLGLDLVDRGDLSAALNCLRKAAEIQPQRSGLLVDLGDTLFSTGQFAEAVAVYQRAQEFLGPNWKVLEKLADAYLGQGDICEAIDILGLSFIAGVDDSVLALMNVERQSPEMIAIKKKREFLLKEAEAKGISPIRMINGWYLPRSDIGASSGFVDERPLYKGRPFADLEHVKLCIARSRGHGLALDIGGNIGCWSWILSDYFERIEAFEPIPILQACFTANVPKKNVVLNKCAVGNASSLAKMAIFDMGAGASFITATMPDDQPSAAPDNQRIVVQKLDDRNFQNVDFMKIDTEGFEAFVVQGAIETITRCKPVMYVEQVWGARYGQDAQHNAVRMLIGLGATATPLGDGANFLIEWS